MGKFDWTGIIPVLVIVIVIWAYFFVKKQNKKEKDELKEPQKGTLI